MLKSFYLLGTDLRYVQYSSAAVCPARHYSGAAESAFVSFASRIPIAVTTSTLMLPYLQLSTDETQLNLYQCFAVALKSFAFYAPISVSMSTKVPLYLLSSTDCSDK